MEKIGKYQILEKLGQGGMGVVYKALDTLIERVVAVKMVAANLDSDPELRARFFREGRSAGRLSHKNIVTIFDLGEDHGTAYIAMEFLEGEDLREKILHGETMDLQTKLRLIWEVCSGLVHAHERSVIHRDIKPANIFITMAGEAKILDFGLARTTVSDLTTSGHALGTPNYMSPEQVRGEKVDYRTDIFSVGVLFYELLTYKKAFQGDSFASTIYKILQNEPEPIESIDPEIPLELCAIAYKALAKDRDQRYQTLRLMLEDLARYTGFSEPGLSTDTPARTAANAPGETSSPRRSDPGVAGTTYSPPRGLTPPPSGGRTRAGAQISDRHGKISGPRDFRAEQTSPDPGAGEEPTQLQTMQEVRASRTSARRLAAVLGSVLVLAAIVWLVAHNREAGKVKPPADPPSASVPVAPTVAAAQEPVAAEKASQPPPIGGPSAKDLLDKASEALKARKYSDASFAAEEVLRLSPGDAEAISIQQKARNSLELVRRSVRQARSFLAAGNYERARSALGEALALDPTDTEALQISDQISQSARRAAEQAIQKATDARSKADEAEAATFAPRTYSSAQVAIAEASLLLGHGKYAEASSKATEAGALFPRAEAEARAQSAANTERAHAAAAEQQQNQLRARSETTHQAYEREREAAMQAGAPEKAREQFSAAEKTAAGARAKLDGGNLDGAARDFEAATTAMQQARNSAMEELRKELSRAAQPPKAPPSAAPPQPAAEAHESPEAIQKAIYRVQEQYRSAMEGKDVDLLRSIWPDLTPQQEQAYRNQWAYTRSLRVVALNSRIEQMQGDTAVLSVQFHNEQEINNGTRRKWDQKATFRLSKRGKSWVIESLSFEGVR
jgi:serine/threonine-protein kinase